MSDNKDRVISSGCHPVLALSKMKSLRDKSALCDVTLEVGDTKIPAHKIVLAASSPYFEFMFTSSSIEESSKESIEIKGFCPTAFLALVDFMYSGYLLVNEETIEDLLKVADFLKIATAKEQCLKYMQRHINVSNCILIKNIAGKHFFIELEKKVNNFIYYNFLEVIKSDAFLELTFDELKKFITEESFCSDESFCEKAISSWSGRDANSRDEFKEALSQIAKVHIESIRQRGLNVYYASRHRRIFCFTKDTDMTSAFDLNNMGLYSVPIPPFFDYNRPVFHDNSICLISSKGNDCGIFNLEEEKWTTNFMPLNGLCSACSDHSRIYLTSKDSKDTFSYDLEKNVLYTEIPLISKRLNPAVTFNENCIYVCGGTCRSAEFRDIRTKHWRSLRWLPKTPENVSATSFNNNVYCAVSPSGELFQYDKCKGVWIEKAVIPFIPSEKIVQHSMFGNSFVTVNAAIPGDHKGFSLGSTDQNLYAFNGKDFYKYNSNKDEWCWLCSDTFAVCDFVCVYPR